MVEWIAKSEHGEYVQHYNPIGCTMSFTTDERLAFRTTDPAEAYKWCRLADRVYGRSTSGTRMDIRVA